MTQANIIGSLVDNRFRILSVLGTGTFGAVYKAEQPDLDRIVALKMLHGLAANTDHARARFEREVHLLASLQHENIVRVYGCGTDSNNCLYLSMEYLDGRTLSDVLAKERRLDWRRTCRIGLQVCAALAAAHKIGIVHRDVAPKNIMLVSENNRELVKVLDFGLSTVLPQSELAVQRLTQTGTVVGTLLYMSPEATMGQKPDERSDVYALGCVLYECLSGKVAFDAESFDQILQKQSGSLPARILGQLDSPDIPKELELVIFKAIQKKQERRFQSADDFAEALNLVLNERWRELDLAGVEMGSGKRSPSRSYKLIWASALALLVIGILALVAFLSVSNQRAPTASAPVVIANPAVEDRRADVQRARSLLEQARAAVSKGNYGQADSLARTALMSIGHQYPDAANSPSMPAEDIEILERITQIYGNGGRVGTLVPDPLPKIRDICSGIILTRDANIGSRDQYIRMHRLLVTVCSIYGDDESAAHLSYQGALTLLSYRRPDGAREFLRQCALMLGPRRNSLAAVDYYLSVSEARIALAEGNEKEARAGVVRAWRDLAKLSEKRRNERFQMLIPLLAIEQALHDEVASKKLFDDAEKTALEAAGMLTFNMNGVGLESGRGLELMSTLRQTVADPKLQARVDADTAKLNAAVHQGPIMPEGVRLEWNHEPN
jgi:serine/threonine-protein kinase